MANFFMSDLIYVYAARATCERAPGGRSNRIGSGGHDGDAPAARAAAATATAAATAVRAAAAAAAAAGSGASRARPPEGSRPPPSPPPLACSCPREARGAAATRPLALAGPVQSHPGTAALAQGPRSPGDGAQLGACACLVDVGDLGGRPLPQPGALASTGDISCTM
ncbi:bcl-2-binding component 3 [Myotis lucifugus]|uniref:bcl-2-binding component 3 n=1 Tax=Myotis lucifugus TaxID=59463 RepID=UPI0006D71858|nr:bcl-2-binding component 3 [Myotis lucifugus]